MVRDVLVEEWSSFYSRYRWSVGRYVVMPDHVHFLVSPHRVTDYALSTVVGRWKEWTAKKIVRAMGVVPPIWQQEFFDHLVRSDESLTEKWNYMRHNPVRAGLVAQPDEWLFAGAIDFEI